LFNDLFKRKKRLRFCRWPMMAMLLCALPLGATAEQVAARHLEGTVHGYLTLKTEEGKVAVMPLFVAITSEMEIVFEGESGDGGGGGPRREFKTNKDATRPSYDIS